jgi:hypothetical protein
MNSSVSITTFVIGLAVGASALAQTPPAGGPPPIPSSPVSSGSLATQSSTIRAFNPGPNGEPRSLYLANGSVVDLPPDLGQPMAMGFIRGSTLAFQVCARS